MSPCGNRGHDWGRWRPWSLDSEGARWYLSEPQVRDCRRCGVTQRHRWWRR